MKFEPKPTTNTTQQPTNAIGIRSHTKNANGILLAKNYLFKWN